MYRTNQRFTSTGTSQVGPAPPRLPVVFSNQWTTTYGYNWYGVQPAPPPTPPPTPPTPVQNNTYSAPMLITQPSLVSNLVTFANDPFMSGFLLSDTSQSSTIRAWSCFSNNLSDYSTPVAVFVYQQDITPTMAFCNVLAPGSYQWLLGSYDSIDQALTCTLALYNGIIWDTANTSLVANTAISVSFST